MSHPAIIKFTEFKDGKLLQKAMTKLGWTVKKSKGVKMYFGDEKKCDAVASRSDSRFDIGMENTKDGINLVYDDMANTKSLAHGTDKFGRLKQYYSAFEQESVYKELGFECEMTERAKDGVLLMEFAK